MLRTVVSIITPTFNSARFLRETIASVLSQSGDFDLQWLVIDGDSRDETVRILQAVGDPRLQWISEADHGQAAAINKGLAMARGDICAWLNADDLYVPGAIATIADAFEQNPSAQWLAGRCEIIDGAGNPVRSNITRYKERRLRSFSYKALLRMNIISQPAVFWRMGFGREVGPLDESLHYTMDYDYWLRMARRRPPMILDQALARFRVHDSSKSRGGHREQFDEGYRVACRYACHDLASRWMHRFNVEKIVWGYRAMRLLGK
jgi:glycosyltransferase involved in cell wall biosynthesis